MEPGPFDSLLKSFEVDEDLVKFARDVACLHGLVNPHDPEAYLVTYFPFSLLPSPIPRAAYLQAMQVQTHFNVLMDRVSQDTEFLEEALASVLEVDEFTARLFNIYKQIQREGKLPTVVLGQNRCDYMLDQASALKQVEINTFAAGMLGLSVRVGDFHRDVLRYVGRLEQAQSFLDPDFTPRPMRAMVKAWELYGSKRAVVLFLDGEILHEHRMLELDLLKWNISVMHRTFEDVISSARLDPDDTLFVDGREVAVVYFRYGHAPKHYPSEQFWDMRLMLERSRAVKCPDIATHLSGTKKVQQVLSQPGVLEKFFPQEKHVVEQLRATFTGLYSLHTGPDGDRAVEMALAAPERFVLKPQREGGGNNVFGSDICSVLKQATCRERAGYILMDKIESKSFSNVLFRLRSGRRPPVVGDCTSELGVVGGYVRHGKELVMNEVVDHTLRNKMASDNEGGMCAGTGTVGSFFLY